jgi:hypothetical protein
LLVCVGWRPRHVVCVSELLVVPSCSFVVVSGCEVFVVTSYSLVSNILVFRLC